MEREHYDYLVKFIIIGNSSTGKSCLMHYFIENKFKKSTTHTIGVEFGSKVLHIGSKAIKLQIWDTAGQERFRSVAKTYYKGALGAIVLYDMTNEETFNAVNQWLKDARDLARPDISCILVGNKVDLKESRKVDFNEAIKYAQEQGINYLETSALTGESISDVFYMLAKQIISKIDNGLIDTSDLQPKILSGLKSSPAKNEDEGKCSYCQRQ